MPWDNPRSQRLPGNWQSIRWRILARDVLCRRCQQAPSVEVHHVRRGDDHSDANLVGLCHPCHQVETQREARETRAAQPKQKRPEGKHPGLR